MSESSVLIVAYHFPPVAGSSGLHRMVSLSRELLKTGFDVHVLSVSLNCYAHIEEANLSTLPPEVKVHRPRAFDSVKTLSIAGKYPSLYKVPDNLQSWIASGTWQGLRLVRRHKISLVISTYPIASAHCIGYFVSRWSGAGWIADFRDPMAQPDYPLLTIQHRAFRWIERRIVNNACLLTFATAGALRYYRQQYPELSPERCLVVNNGYDEHLFHKLEEGRPDVRKVLLHSGALYPSERDPTQLFQALAELKTSLVEKGFLVRLRATGYDSFVTTLVRRYQLEELVEIQPLVSNHDALCEMGHAYALLVLQAANCNDQIPVKIYEYLRSLRPIVCLAAPEGETYRTLEHLPGCWCAPLDDKEQIVRVLKHVCLETDVSDYRRKKEAVTGFERGAQARPLLQWLQNRNNGWLNQ